MADDQGLNSDPLREGAAQVGCRPPSVQNARKLSPLLEVVLVAAAVTGLVVAQSVLLPDDLIAGAIAATFLGATALFVWRKDDATVVASGLSLGGLVLAERPWAAQWRAGAKATAWALAVACVVFVPFFYGFHAYWKVQRPWNWNFPSLDLASFAAGQLLVVAFPEEAFYRGYMQSALDRAFPPRLMLFGAAIGPSLLLTSALFALGHVATVHSPGRLAVFFPSLVFGWLRARTKGIGAPLVFHALCNVFAEILARGFGLHL